MIRILSLLVLTFCASFAHAGFQIEAAVNVNTGYVQAEACNNGYSAPIVCRTTAYGQLPNGVYINSWVSLYLAPGQCDYAYVYAGPYYFVNGYATAYCDFAGY